jgi:hypothetical protein
MTLGAYTPTLQIILKTHRSTHRTAEDKSQINAATTSCRTQTLAPQPPRLARLGTLLNATDGKAEGVYAGRLDNVGMLADRHASQCLPNYWLAKKHRWLVKEPLTLAGQETQDGKQCTPKGCQAQLLEHTCRCPGTKAPVT